MKRKALTITAALLLTLGMTAMATAEDDPNEDRDVEVEISEDTVVDLQPDQLDFEELSPGDFTEDAAGEYSNDYDSIQIENAGSQTIDRVWLETSTPENNPYATGDASNYDSANFLTVRLDNPWDASKNLEETDFADTAVKDDYVFVNRVDFEEPSDLSYVFTENEEYSYGRFRAADADTDTDADQEYFWATNIDTDTAEGDAQLQVGEVAHDRDSTGATDFTQDSDVETYDDGDIVGDAEAGENGFVFDGVEIGSKEYAVAVYEENDGEVVTQRTATNPEADTGFDDAASVDYLVDGASFEPGDTFPVEVGLAVPRGVAQGEFADNGDADPGTLTVIVEGAAN